MRRLLAAIGFLTIIPVGIKTKDQDLGKSMVFFPLVGLLIGGFLVGTKFISSYIFPSLLTCVLVITSWVVITGCIHLDGFCDTIDGFTAGKNKEEILRIMEDSHIGVFAVVGLICLLLLKISALLSTDKSSCLLLAPSMGRWAMVIAATTMPYPKSYGLGKAFVDYAGKKEAILATIIMITIGIFLFKWHFFCILGIVVSALLLSILYIKKRLGGVSGDTLGALCEVIEVITLLCEK